MAKARRPSEGKPSPKANATKRTREATPPIPAPCNGAAEVLASAPIPLYSATDSLRLCDDWGVLASGALLGSDLRGPVGIRLGMLSMVARERIRELLLLVDGAAMDGLKETTELLYGVKADQPLSVRKLAVPLSEARAGVRALRLNHGGTDRRSPDFTEPRPTGRRLAELVGVSDDTFRRVREAAKIIVAEKGGAARNRTYTVEEVDRLIVSAAAGTFMERDKMVAEWAKYGTQPRM